LAWERREDANAIEGSTACMAIRNAIREKRRETGKDDFLMLIV